MPQQEESAPPALAPSELLRLNEEQAWHTGLLQVSHLKTNHLYLDSVVFMHELIVGVTRTAFLAAERNGEIRLTVSKGIGREARQDRLIVERGSETGNWPQGSLEARIGRALARRSGGYFTGNELAALIDLIVDRAFWQTLIIDREAGPYLLKELVKALVMRGIVVRIRGHGRLLGGNPYRSVNVILTEAGQSAVEQYDLEKVRQLFFQCKRKRPDVWSLIGDEIIYGLAATDSSD